MKKISKFLSIVLAACMIFGMLPALSASAEDGEAASSNFMEIVGTGNNSYLSTVGSNAFNVLMYNNTFSGTFGDQHMGGIELSLNGLRIATNGDMHMLPTPEQWDATPAPSRGTRVHDEETGTITIPMTFTGAADGTLLYDLVAASTDDGVKMSMILRSDMPESLIGKARFNLELLPSAYRNKGFQADTDGDGAYDDYGVFPLHPQDPMVDVERPNLPSQAFYVKQWHEDRGDDQPLPFAVGYGFNMAAEGQDYGISFESTTGDIIELYDGRNRAQNGWYVLSTLISATKEGETAIEWIIKPDVDPDWVREPNVGFSQVGYTPYQEKFAVVELDKWDENYPRTMSLWRVNADGSEEKVSEKEITEPYSWMRFKYSRFDFTEVTEVGLYRIHYGDYKGEVFPIAKTVYDRIWQTCLSGFMAVQMDHIAVREGYKIWHGAAHMDDLSFGPAGLSYFDGQSTPASLPDAVKAKGHTEEVHIDGVNKGGWFDAGDFDIQTSRNTQVLGYFIDAAESWDNMEGYDDLTVVWDDETGGTVEMHRPDGVPDVVQQVVHGAKQIIAQYDVLGIIGGTVEVRTLRQYTHLGDPSSDTDGWIYDPELGPGEVVEKNGKVYSSVPDDRYMMLGRRANNNPTFFSNATSFAATAYLAAPYYPEFAQYAMKAANDVWYKEHMEAEPTVSGEWNQLVQFTLATKRLEELGIPYAHQDELNYAYYKARLDLLADEAVSGGIGNRVNCLYIMDIMDDDYRAKCAAAAEAVADGLTVNTMPYGVNFTSGSGWGGSPNTYSGVRNISMIYHFFPNEKFKQNILRSVNYLLGRHPATNCSWISGIGTKSAMHPYNSNRAEESYIPGSILPGHITFSDYVESMDDFSFLWFEGESIINYQSSWLPVGIAAGAIARAEEEAPIAQTKDFTSSFDAELVTKTSSSMWGGGSSNYYFSDDGFNMIMYATTFDRTFGDQHCAGIELIQDGRRIATNGDIHLLPTPEQWDATPPPTKGTVTAEGNTVTVPMTIPAETFSDGTPENPAVPYKLIAEPEEGGIKLTVKLDAPLPEDLVGKAGFNLEFLPAVFIEKSYMTDTDGDGTYDDFGVFPRDPRDQMEDVSRARTNNQAWYVQEWNEDRGDAQPVPFTSGKKMTFAAESDEYRIRIASDDGLALYDGRNRAQNGWFVLRTLIPAGKTEIVWHISPDTNEGWTREPNITHSQVGYEPELSKVAVIELDPNYVGSDSAVLKRLNDVGEYVTVATKPLGEAKSWQRYIYKDFDFSDVKEPGMYVIEYDGVRSDPFPIKKGVYKDIWTESVGNYMAVQMDHMRIREGYKIWRNAAHMDDALQAPVGVSFFDGQSMGASSDSPYEAYEHIPGLDVGGFSDAGDFDIQVAQNLGVINTLALAYQVYGEDYDTLDIDWVTHNVELHRSDKSPDIAQLAKHGALNILAQIEAVGYTASVIEVPTLRQYTHLGDGSKDTDNRIYDPSLAEDETVGLRSGKRDDRLAFFQTKSTSNVLNAATAIAAAASVLPDSDPDKARMLAAAEKIWADEPDSHVGTEGGGGWFSSGPADWNLALELFYATGKEVYKDRILECLDTQLVTSGSGWFGPAFASSGWKVVKVIDKLGDEAKAKFEAALEAYAPSIGAPNASNPYGVSDTTGMWGGSGGVVSGALTASVLHKYYPDLVSADSVFRAINYILGTHPYNSTSWVSGVGTNSLKKGYGSNRADFFYIAGGLAPGYVTIAPDFPEALDDFNFLWFENEYTVEVTANWILLTLGADDFARELDAEPELKLGPNVIKDPESPTGYTVKFLYKNDDASRVQFAGDIALRNDADRTDRTTYSPFEYRPGLMRGASFTDEMEKRTFTIDGEETEVWYYEVPMAAGANQYWFYVDGNSNYMVPDPANHPKWSPNSAANKNAYNAVYVPYDPKQDYAPTKAREAENPRTDGKVGAWDYYPITIGGRVHYMGIYTPYGYDPDREEPYKLIFTLHGAGQDESDWMGIGSVQNIMDNLVAEGRTEPAIIVSPTTNNNMISGDNYSNLMDIIIPYLEENYNISSDPMDRAFCGLSMGSMNTQNIINGGADRFGYYGPFSGGMRVNTTAPGLESTHILFGSGSNESSIQDSAVQPLNDAGGYAVNIVVTGAHDFNTWCQMFRIICEDYLWKPEAFGDTGEPPVLDKAALEAAIAEAEAIDTAPYTDSSVANLAAALEAAREALENATSQYRINEAATALTNAIARLRVKPSNVPKGDYVKASTIEVGKSYVIVADGAYAMSSEEVPGKATYSGASTTRGAVPVEIADGKITSPVTADMLWTFEENTSPAAYDGLTQYYLRDSTGKYLRRGSMSQRNAALILDETTSANARYYTWSFAPYEGMDATYAMYVNSERAYGNDYPGRVGADAAGFDIPGTLNQRTDADPFAFMNEAGCAKITLYELVPTPSTDIDFTNPADAGKFEIVNQNQSEIEEGEGLALIATRPAFEDCKGQNSGDQATIPEDVVMVPVSGDWTATLEVDFSTNGASNGYYQFFGFYASEGDDFQNLAGIRGGDGAMQNFERHDGTITHQDEDGVNSTPGFASNGTYFLRIEKEGDTYTCYRSADGEDFTEMFAYAASGIDADYIVIDAYTGMTQNYKFTLKKLTIEGGGAAPEEPEEPEVPIQHPELPIWENPEYSFEERAADLVGRMTVTQKASQIINNTPAIPAAKLGNGALNVPSTKDLGRYTWWSETLHGCGGGVNYPQNTTVASTWNPDLYYQESTNIGQEIRERGVTNLNYYSPTINMHRDPRWGRNEESYSEDVLLTAAMGTAWAQGLEGKDREGNILDPNGYFMAHSTIKHYVANNNEGKNSSDETGRLRAGAISSLRMLREYYALPYGEIIRGAHVTSVMTAYSYFGTSEGNFDPSSYSSYLMDTLLRQVYGLTGHVTSDCDSVASMQNLHYINRHTGEEITVIEALSGALAHGEDLECNGGHSSSGSGTSGFHTDYNAQINEMIAQAVETDKGIFTENTVDISVHRLMTARMQTGEFDGDIQIKQDAAARQENADALRAQRRELVEQINGEGVVMLQNKGTLPLNLGADGVKKVVIVGSHQTSTYTGLYSQASANQLNIQRGIIEAVTAKKEDVEFTLITNNAPTDADKEAIAAADAVIVVVGTGNGDSSEDRDRASIVLPNNLESFISTVGKLNANTILVMETCGPMRVRTFQNDVNAILWSSFGGQWKTGFGAVISGAVNPSGKTTDTWYQDVADEGESDVPAVTDYDLLPSEGKNGRTYMYYDGYKGTRAAKAPSYPFGYGLSYTTFAYSNLKLDKTSYDANDTVKVSFDVKNTGSVAGKEVTQLYVAQPEAPAELKRPIRRLEGFQKIELQPGETKTVSMEVKIEDLAFFDEAKDCFDVDLGAYQVQVGTNSMAAADLTADFTVTGKLEEYPVLLTVKANAAGDSEHGIEQRLIYNRGNMINPQLTVCMNNEKLYGYIIANQKSGIKEMKSCPLPEGMTFKYRSNRSSVVKVDGDQIQAVGPGVATVTVTGKLGDHEVKADFVVYVKVATEIDDLTVNGETVEKFSPTKNNYSVRLEEGEPVPVVAAVSSNPDLDVVVTQAAEVPGVATVVATDRESGLSNTYTVSFKYRPSASFLPGIDFTNPADAEKYEIVAKDTAEVQKYIGIETSPTLDAFEPVSTSFWGGETLASEPKDLIKIPVSKDWTATLCLDYDPNNVSFAFSTYFAFLAMQGDDYKNMVGIRATNSTFQDYLRKNGSVEDSTASPADSGFRRKGYYWLRLQKDDTTYTAYWSTDGQNFTKAFTLEDTEIDADYILIDAYKTMNFSWGGSTGDWKFTLKNLEYENEGIDLSAFDPEVASIAVNGEAIAFNPDTYTYNVAVDRSAAAPVIGAWKGNDATKITVIPVAGSAGTGKVIASVGDKTKTYTLSFNYKPESDYFADGDFNAAYWTVLNEDAGAYSVEKGKGIVLPTQRYDIYSTGAAWKNAFTMPAMSNWEVVTKVYFPARPSANYQQAMFLVWQDEDNYIRMNLQNTGSNLVIEPGRETSGSFSASGTTQIQAAADNSVTIYFKLKRDGDNYTAAYSLNGTDFTQVYAVDAAYVDPKLALFATMNNDGAQVDAQFEYVYVAARDGLQPDFVEMMGWAAQNVADYIAADLPLETSDDLVLSPAPKGYAVTLASSDPAVIAADGTVTPAAEDKDVTVTVTAAEGVFSGTSAPVTIHVPGDGGPEIEVPIEHPELPIWENQYDYTFAERAADLIARMTPAQKGSQSVSTASAISASALGGGALNVPATKSIPSYEWWSEALHGYSRGQTSGAVIYPQNLTMASTWNPELYYRQAVEIGDEIREKTQKNSETGNAKNLNFYSPTVNMHRDPRWGRNEESFSEDVYLTGMMASEFVLGMEGKDREGNLLDPDGYLKTMCTTKHYVANNSERNRLNGGATTDLRAIREYYTAPYAMVIRKADVRSVMTAYSTLNGEPTSYSSYLMDTLLRQTFGFNGHITSDCDSAATQNRHGYVNPYTGETMTDLEALAGALAHGEDLECNGGYSGFGTYATKMTRMLDAAPMTDKGTFTENAVDISLLHMFTDRIATGEFDENLAYTAAAQARVDAGEGGQSAKRLAIIDEVNREGVVMLQNNGLLPLQIPASGAYNVVIIGSWQTQTYTGLYSAGVSGNSNVNIQKGVTDAIQAKNPDAAFTYITSNDLTEENTAAVKAADVVVVVTGTNSSYSKEDGDRTTIALPNNQAELISNVGKLNPKTVAIMETCGAMQVKTFQNDVAAILWSSYGGLRKGVGFGEIITGATNPSGKLTDTWYQDVNDAIGAESDITSIYDYNLYPNEESDGRTYMYYKGAKAPSYPFGYGLSFTTFEYSNLVIDKTAYDANDTIQVKFDVKNTGSVAGKEVTQLYVAQPNAPAELNRPIRRLEGFEKIELQPGETKTVEMEVAIPDLAFFDETDKRYEVDTGAYQIQVGTDSAHADLRKDFTVSGEMDVYPVLLTVKANQVGDTEQGIEERLIYDKGATVNPQLTVCMSDESLCGYVIAHQMSPIDQVASSPLPEGMTFTYKSNRPSVVSCKGGVIKAVNAGVATVTVTGKLDDHVVTADFVVYVVASSKIDGITLNGEPMAGFNRDKFGYELSAADFSAAPVVGYVANTEGLKVTVEQFTGVPGVATITAVEEASGSTSVYRIGIGNPPVSTDFSKGWPEAQGKGWSVTGGNMNATFGENGLTIVSEAAAGTNIYTEPAYGEWAAQTSIKLAESLPADNQQAGLIVKDTDDTYVKLVYERVGGRRTNYYVTAYAVVNGDQAQAARTGNLGAINDVTLRIIKSGNAYTFAYSTDGVVWTDMSGNAKVNMADPKIGPYVANVEGVTATFDGINVAKISQLYPRLASVKLNGAVLTEFDPETFIYNFAVEAGAAAPVLEATAADADIQVAIEQLDASTGKATITAFNDIAKAVYSFYFDLAPVSDYIADGGMNDRWSIERENAAVYSIQKGKGLVLPTQAGDIHGTGGAWENAFVMPAQGNWQAVAKVVYPNVPTANYQQAMFLVWQDENNYIRMNCQTSNLNMEPGVETGGSFNGNLGSGQALPSEDGTVTLYFMIDKAGNDYTVGYSQDGVNFTRLNTAKNVQFANPKIGLFATQNSSSAQMNMYFEYVAVTWLNGVEQMTYPDMQTWAAQNVADYVAADLPAEATENIALSPVPHGYTVTLNSSDPAVIAADGTVTQPEYTKNVQVTVTATNGFDATSSAVTIRVPGKGVTPPPVDYTALNAAIAAAEAVDKSLYTDETVAAMEAKLAAAKAALASEDQAAVDAAASALNAAVAALELKPVVPPVDYTALNAAIAAAEAVNKSLYTDASVAAMEAKLAAAKAALASEDQAAVDAAASALNAAVAALVVKPGPGPGPGPDLDELLQLIEDANARAAAAQRAAAEALAAAQAIPTVDTTAIEAAKAAAEAAKAAAEQAAAAAEAAKAAAAASDAEAVAKAAEAAQAAKDAAEKAAAAATAQAAAQRAQAAAEAARAAADEAAALTAADKVAAEAAEAAAKAAEAAAKAAKEAAEAADAAAAAEAAKSAASAAEAAKAQAEAQKAQAAAEAAEKAAQAAQAEAEKAAAQAGSDKAAAEAAKLAAEAAKVAAQNAKAAAEAAAAAAADSNAAAVAAAAQAAADAAKVAKALEDVAAAKAELAAIQAKAEQDAADAKKAQEAAEKAKAAAEAAELGAARYYALAELARAADGIDTIDYSPEQIEAVAKTVADAIEAIGAAADKAAVEKALADALKAISETPADTCPSRKFTDVPKQGYWAHAGIDYCVAKGLMNGMSETVFAPNDLTTRAQLVTILYRAVGSPKVEYKATFSDVPAGIWYSDAIEWAAANGVVNGIGGGKFAPDANVTREQIAAILYRYSGSPKVEGKLDAFKDPADVSPYAVDAMIWATSEGIINGIPDGADVKLSPKDYATRAQIATMFARFLSE